MGNICCAGGKEESKASALAAVRAEDSESHNITDLGDHKHHHNSINDSNNSMFDHNGQQQQHQPSQQQPPSQQAPSNVPPDASPADAARRAANDAQLQARREEQNRLEVIVQMAGRGMVSVRSTRGSTGYYDQGFAAALGQHLERTTTFADQLPIRLPRPSSSSAAASSLPSPPVAPTNGTGTHSPAANNNNNNNNTKTTTVVQRLSQPPWENIALGNKGTGLAGCGGENPNTYMDHVAVSFLDSVVPKKERIFHGGVGPMVENLL